ncbi:MAG: hypothetical protein GIW99_10670 [Candidatus Eremiobacteraeota bacterium]|nr:hypothetical protein [Candidatus Eremiobacteraeota bacterium]MBC5828125.1 hypothetical protein [Candidatus Eremiobacteraeota bacterium]
MIVCADLLLPGTMRAEELHAVADGAIHQFGFRSLGRGVQLRFDDPQAAQIFARRYADFPTCDNADFHGYAGRHGNEYVFWTSQEHQYRWVHGQLSQAQIAFLADAVFLRSFFTSVPNALTFHGAVCYASGVAVAIAAESTGGKTTTAVACARRGMPLYSDERCVLLGDTVHSFPRSLSIRPGGLELLLRDRVETDGGIGQRLRGQNIDWACVRFSELFGSAEAPPVAELKVIFAIRGRSSSPRVAQTHWSQRFAPLLYATQGSCRGIDLASMLARALTGIKTFDLVLGAPDQTARLLAETVQAAAVPPLAVSTRR